MNQAEEAAESNLKMIAVCSMWASPEGTDCRAWSVWLFDIPCGHPKAREELDAAFKAMNPEGEGYVKHYQISCPLSAHTALPLSFLQLKGTSADRAFKEHNALTIGFAALSSWGLGPIASIKQVSQTKHLNSSLAEIVEQFVSRVQQAEIDVVTAGVSKKRNTLKI